MLYIRGESGLGDSIYLYPIVKSYLDNVTEPIAVYSNYPKVFEDLKCVVLPFSKKRDDETQIFSYLPHKTNSETTIIEDITSSCAYDINFNKDHSIKNHNLVKKILKHKKNNKKICLIRYVEPRHNRKGIDNLDCDPTIINKFISEFKKEYYFVGIGKSNCHNIRCDIDLMGQTSVSDLFDLVFISDLVIAQVGYTVPLCELLHKNNIAIFPKKWQTANPFLKTITPNKICGEYTSHVYDDQDFIDISKPEIIVRSTKISTQKKYNIFITGGIGDFLRIVDCSLDISIKNNLDTIYLACSRHKEITDLIRYSKDYIFHDIKILWNELEDYSDPRFSSKAYYSLEHFTRITRKSIKPAIDCSIKKLFIKKTYNTDTFLFKEKEQFKYPYNINTGVLKNYISICPYSYDDRNQRNFTQIDWRNTISILESTMLNGVVLGSHYGNVPKHPLLLNLINKTSVVESLEICNSSLGYLGIDSWLSTIGALVYLKNKHTLQIKCNNPHGFKHSFDYWGLNKDSKNIVSYITSE